jgi:hypothetical protein
MVFSGSSNICRRIYVATIIVVWNTGFMQDDGGGILFGDVYCRSISA